MFYVYGDYGYQTEQELFTATNLDEAKRFAQQYIRHGDFGGYNVIDVAWFSECGEFMVEWSMNAPQEIDA